MTKKENEFDKFNKELKKLLDKYGVSMKFSIVFPNGGDKSWLVKRALRRIAKNNAQAAIQLMKNPVEKN